MATDKDKFPLADLIGALGKELREANRRARAQSDFLELREATVEVGIGWSKTGKTGLQLYVFELGGEADRSNTQTMSVTLKPASSSRVALRKRPDLPDDRDLSDDLDLSDDQ